MEQTPQTFGEYLKSYFKNLKELARHPLALLPTVIITGIWILLGFLKKGMSESPVMAALNFLTFAQGGIFGGVVGAIGGVIGKILVAGLVNALVLPLFVKGARPMARFKEGFKGFGKSFAARGEDLRVAAADYYNRVSRGLKRAHRRPRE